MQNKEIVKISTLNIGEKFKDRSGIPYQIFDKDELGYLCIEEYSNVFRYFWDFDLVKPIKNPASL